MLPGLALGCSSGRVARINEELQSRVVSPDRIAKRAPEETYVVDPPDAIQVEVQSASRAEVTRNCPLRSDGVVTLPLLNDVPVAGLTTAQIRDKLQQMYAQYYKEPVVLVTVSAYLSKHIYVYGEVGRQGTQPYTGHQNVSDAIGAAGGITRRAASGSVKVIRGGSEDAEVFMVDLDALVFEGQSIEDVSLAENDVVYIPPNAFAWVGYQIDNILFPFRSIISVMWTAETITGAGGTGGP
jgi:polysaccharide export outer membrane protein